jgi:hypothetical protein
MEGTYLFGNNNGTYLYNLSIPSDAQGNLSYFYFLSDVHDNWLVTETRVLDIIDDDPPTILEDISDSMAVRGFPFLFKVRAMDNVGLDHVNVTLRFSDDFINRTMQLDGVSPLGIATYSFSAEIPSSGHENLTYGFDAVDLWGNHNRSNHTILSLMDENIPPSIDEDGSGREAIKGLTYSFNVLVSDDVESPLVFVEYWFADEPHESRTMELGDEGQTDLTLYPFVLTISIPRDAIGPLHYFFAAVDSLGEWDEGIVNNVSVINAPPVATGLSQWIVREESEERLDLGDYLSDANDALSSLTVTCQDANITVDGLVLSTYFDDWTEDHSIMVSVSDGENTTSVNIMLTIINVNDPPYDVVILSPTDGSVFGIGEPISFQVVFGDPDIIAGQVITIVWTSDMEGELQRTTSGTFEDFTLSDLEPGTHKITVRISDGEEFVTASVDITISDKVQDKDDTDQLPYVGILIAVVLLIVAGIAIMWKLRRP